VPRVLSAKNGEVPADGLLRNPYLVGDLPLGVSDGPVHCDVPSPPLAREQVSSPHASITNRGGSIVEAERIVGIVYNAEGQVGRLALPKLYDLIFTDRRLVGVVTVKTGGARIAGQLLGGVIGQAVAASVARGGADEKRAAYAGIPRDQVAAHNPAHL